MSYIHEKLFDFSMKKEIKTDKYLSKVVSDEIIQIDSINNSINGDTHSQSLLSNNS